VQKCAFSFFYLLINKGFREIKCQSREKVRLINRLGKKLLEVCPQILKLGKLKNKKIITILVKYPDFSKYQRITLKSLLKIKGIGKKGAFFLLKRLNNIEYMPGLTDIYKTIIFSYAKRD